MFEFFEDQSKLNYFLYLISIFALLLTCFLIYRIDGITGVLQLFLAWGIVTLISIFIGKIFNKLDKINE